MIAGLWWGYNIGLFVQNVCLILFVARLNWHTEAHNVSLLDFLLHFTEKNSLVPPIDNI